jgi:TonB family protein
VVQKIYQNISYPSRAVSKNQQGTVRVAIKIARSGELQSALTTQESKHSSLNRAALKAVEKAAPFPTLPEEITADSFELSIPITFRLQ